MSDILGNPIYIHSSLAIPDTKSGQNSFPGSQTALVSLQGDKSTFQHSLQNLYLFSTYPLLNTSYPLFAFVAKNTWA